MRIISRPLSYAGALLLAGTAALAAPAAAQAAAALPGPPVVPCSSSALVAAIQQANSARFATLVLSRGCNYVLTSAAATGDGLPPITGNLVILGTGGTTISRSATTGFRIVDVAPGGTLTLANVTVANGNGPGTGGGILDNGNLVLRGVRLTGNTAPDGGGLFVGLGGRATVSSSLIAGNTAPALGGGILDEGGLTLQNVRLTGNTSGTAGGLGVGGPAQATVSFSQLTGNSATSAVGGGIQNAGQLSVDHSRLAGNSAAAFGGGLSTEAGGTSRITRTAVAHNSAARLGGGIANLGSTVLTLARVVFNQAGDGAASPTSPTGPSRCGSRWSPSTRRTTAARRAPSAAACTNPPGHERPGPAPVGPGVLPSRLVSGPVTCANNGQEPSGPLSGCVLLRACWPYWAPGPPSCGRQGAFPCE